MRDTIEEDIALPGGLQLPYAGGTWLYIAREGELGFTAGGIDIASIETAGDALLGLDKNLNVYAIDAHTCKHKRLELHPIIKVVSNGEQVTFLSFFASIFFQNGDFIPLNISTSRSARV
jgi:hypothetical protein